MILRLAPSRPRAPSLVALLVASLGSVGWSGCSPNPVDETPNMLPTQGGDAEDDGTTGMTSTGVPATYRFTCMDVQLLGSADADSLQAGLMESTWGSDIAGFRLNLLIDFLNLDAEAGTGELMVRSGIGRNNNDQCSEPESDSQVLPVTFTEGASAYAADNGEGVCSKADTTSAAFGTFDLQFTGDEVLYIYAENNMGQSFNCTTDPSPDAVPIRAVSASFTLSEDEQTSWGNLTACMLESEAQNLCACLGTCPMPDPPEPMCGCNPDAVPLASLLLGVTTTENCTQMMGEPAFDVQIGFVAQRLSGVPDRCE